jgi:tRNA G18 (ribose-2'-O)-methylase SpoU
MRVEWIDSPGDPRVALYRDVSDPELVRQRGLFIAEGRLVVRRLIEDGRHVLQSVLVSKAAWHSLEPCLAPIADRVPIYVCDAGGVLGITGHHIHRGCLALAERPAPRSLEELLPSARTVIVLEGVTNADNVGGVFRNAAAFGVDAILLSPTCCDPYYRKAIRTSMAATLRVPFARRRDWPAALAEVRAAGFRLVALTPRAPSEDLRVFLARSDVSRVALLVGTEGDGLTSAAETMADHRVCIQIRPEVDSLNLAVATGIALYALRHR